MVVVRSASGAMVALVGATELGNEQHLPVSRALAGAFPGGSAVYDGGGGDGGWGNLVGEKTGLVIRTGTAVGPQTEDEPAEEGREGKGSRAVDTSVSTGITGITNGALRFVMAALHGIVVAVE